MRLRVVVGIGILALLSAMTSFGADPTSNGLRGPTPLTKEPSAPRLPHVENFDVKRGRAYTSQPPTIPHAIDKYEITSNVNFCMYCHARTRTAASQAPMVSVTHYMDRDQNYLAEVSPRRYFCTQCHVVQTDAHPPVSNEFLDVDQLIERARAAERKGASEPAASASPRR
jgi:cytochrome c-type protein NapB